MNEKPLLVMKFGGTSVGNSDAMKRVKEIVKDVLHEGWMPVVVLSAMAGVTDELLRSTEMAKNRRYDQVLQAAGALTTRHYQVVDELIPETERKVFLKQQIDQLISMFAEYCRAIDIIGEATPRVLDAIAGIGEMLCVRIFAEYLNSSGIPARSIDATKLIVTDHSYQAAHPIREKSERKVKETLLPILQSNIVPVVTGFIAATEDGTTTTLGRGGSDYSAALLGAYLPAAEVWIWTDVDGVMTADPRIVPDATTIDVLTFREIGELAYYGAKVVHPKTMQPLIDAGIIIRVRNTFNPTHPGTLLTLETDRQLDGEIKAVTSIKGQALVTIEGRGMLGVPGVAARAFGAVAATGTSVPLITQASSEQSICFAVPLSSVETVLRSLNEAFSRELATRDIDRIWATDEVVIVTIVGAAMRSTPGIAGRIFGKLGSQGINVIAIAQGSSEVSISIVIDKADEQRAVRAIHELIVSKNEKAG
ncbi:MAG: aspartate kinase [Anaerolineales bacterium]|nr:aspartate kinase [Anaerolineales bacterium]MCS7247222.1 aspartate kinase [Anaerolineales bacterium]MDW8161033.1 aspartate kinase [Anaerolineales bacterium]MDW8447628.1 aspartate kinase [Anaerolineales bacterium]